MIGDVLVNSYAYRIVEGSVGIAYDSDVDNAIKNIKEVISSSNNVSNDNEPIVGIEAFGESSIDISYRYWVSTNSFFKIQYEVNLSILNMLREKHIIIPFPQREIKIHENV